MSVLIRKAAVRAKLGVGNTKLHEMIRAREFPSPIKLPCLNGKQGRISYWSAEVVDAWISDKVRESLADAIARRRNDPFGRTQLNRRPGNENNT